MPVTRPSQLLRLALPALARLLPAGLARRFGLAMVGLVSVVLVGTGAVTMWVTYHEATASAVQVQREKAQAAAERVAQFVEGIESQVGWTTRAEWSRVSPEQRRYDFIRLQRQVPAITDLQYIDGAGREQLRLSRLEPDVVGSGQDFSADPRFTRAVAERSWHGPVYFRRGSEPYMTLSLAHVGRNPGVTAASVNLKLIWDVITAIRIGQAGYAFVTDATGRLVAHPDMSLVLRETDLSRLPQVARAIAGGAATPTTVLGPDGRRVLSAHAAIPQLGWMVFVELPRREVLAPVWVSLTQTLALLALGIVLALLLGGWLARRMVVPIQELQAGAQRLGEGDLSQRITLDSQDEIGALARRFNDMAGSIQEAQETLEAKVASRTHELNERSDDLTEALERQTATAEILKIIASSPTDTQPVFQAIADSAKRLLDGHGCSVFLYTGDMIQLAAFTPISPEADAALTAAYPRPLRSDAMTDALRDGRPFRMSDIEASDTTGRLREHALRRGWRSLATVPLVNGGATIGTIVVSRAAPGDWPDDDIELLRTFADQSVIAIENARLFNETKEALERQTATAEVLQVINANPGELAPVFEAMLERAVRLCGADLGYLQRHENGRFTIVADHGAGGVALGMSFDPSPGGAFRAMLDGERVVQTLDVSDSDAYRQRDPGRVALVEIALARTALWVALRREGEVLGNFLLYRHHVEAFTDRQIALLEAFADQAVIAIENARLLTEQREALEQQQASADILSVISSSVADAQPVFEKILESCKHLFGGDELDVLLVDDQGQLTLAAYLGQASDIVAATFPAPVERTPAGRAIRERQAVHWPDLVDGADVPGVLRKMAKLIGYRSMVFAPMLWEGRGIGAIGVARSSGPFKPKELAMLQTFADQAVIAIQNADLFNEAQMRARELSASLDNLRLAQDRLVQTEKLASLGQLTAGIAHEIKNPLNFVNNFASLSAELVQELAEALTAAGEAVPAALREEVSELADMLRGNLEKVVQHGQRADSIVRNMLAHSRQGGGERREVALNPLVEEAMALAWHGARAEKPGMNVTLEKQFDPEVGEVSLFPQEFTRVLLNLVGNAVYATAQRVQRGEAGYGPLVRVTTQALGDAVEVTVRDNGTGIPETMQKRIFEPFFTTKPAGEGTGLGLSLSHDIVVKQHGGTFGVTSEEGHFTEFRIVLPRVARQAMEEKA